ncbi:MAG TPA: hypothetical protein VKG38_05965 [Solirubrobacteraceae bacterium]|nr:hypothetical protein [Solirubrobacteraceae bacterium]
MSSPTLFPRRLRRRPLGLAALAAGTVALGGAVGLPGLQGSSRAAAGAAGEVIPQTDASVPAHNVTMIGATPQEAGAPGADETWGIGESGPREVLVRYTSATGWVLGPALLDSSGQPLSGFRRVEGSLAGLAGQMTPDGSGVLLGTVSGGRQVLLARGPGQSFQETPAVPPADLEAGEHLFNESRAPMIAPLDEAGSAAGALIVPVLEGGGVEHWVLHWSGEKQEWTREQIEIPGSSSGEFRVLAIGASSPSNAWLLARLSSPAGGVALFRRHPPSGGEAASWRPVAVEGAPGEALTVPLAGKKGKPLFIVPGAEGSGTEAVHTQVLTVTSEGVWIDGQRADGGAPTTMYFKPGAPSLTSWCDIEGEPAGTEACDHALPEPLPTEASRSIAWANPALPFGERVITGLAEGESLRLEGESFATVLALGGSGNPSDNPGGGDGAAFSNPREGWLGTELGLPVHLSLAAPVNKLSPWPVPFRRPLFALAAQPGAPVGALSSEALAVGERGEVARYEPGKGWQPESLFAPGGRVERPLLRAVAWPTPTRAYAVGNEGQMWLWRGETGLWEPDPASPPNFRGNLLGIAFDSSDPSRGYAVGSGDVEGQGVLLRYGKTWTQEPAEALPPEVRGANFTAVAFAGSEAIVAWRRLVNPASAASYVGGLIVNDGSGWHVDDGAVAAMEGRVPGAVAGLPDGGAAFAAGAPGKAAELFEREASGAPWRAAPTPLPGTPPGSITLFREGGALRALLAGGEPLSFAVESVSPPPPGSPPNLIGPYSIGSVTGVLRQTATGWSDEAHEFNPVREPAGNFLFYDTPYQPDPVFATLVSETGSQGWAVGGYTTENELTDTADVDRYPADGSTPPGVGSSTIPTEPAKEAIFAIGGGAACAAPCAKRSEAGIGPDVWLSAARKRAEGVPGVRAFIYTGPRLANRREHTGTAISFPYPSELRRYAELLAPYAKPVYTAAAPTDLDEAESENSFESAFNPQWPTAPSARSCPRHPLEGEGCHLAYAFSSSEGGARKVRVIVLDDTRTLGGEQLGWLEGELEAAFGVEPAIVVGNADLNEQLAAKGAVQERAAELAVVLVHYGASAYLFDAKEEDVHRSLTVGGQSIPTFGSGTLGYVFYQHEQNSSAFLGASGFLLAKVGFAGWKPQPKEGLESNRDPDIGVSLIPNIGELAMEAKEGTLLRRSEAAEFAALARRPRSGSRGYNQGPSDQIETDPYIPIPSYCVGATCAERLEPEYTFSSSDPEVGQFVEKNTASAEANAVLLGPDEKPIPDPQSGLFCAYNPGQTTVTISTGGLSASQLVTVQAGSVRRPCGTTPIKVAGALPQATGGAPPPPPPPTGPAGPAPAPAPTPVPLPAPPAAPTVPPPPAAARVTPAATPFFLPPAAIAPLLAALPPPVPTPARPTPPSGTSAVTTPVEAPEKQEEKEEATESVGNKAVAYRVGEHDPSPAYLLGIVVLAAFAGASARRRPRRDRREVRVAPATISAMRAQSAAERRRMR